MSTAIFIITGEQGSGKTTFLEEAISLLKEKNIKIGGVLAPGFWHENQRDRFDLVNLTTGDRILFCQRKEVPGWDRIRHFYVNPAGQSFGGKALLESQRIGCHVVVIDEIGPFELQGKGWAKPLDELLRRQGIAVVISVRKKLLHEVIGHWNIQNYALTNVENTTPGAFVEEILKSTHGSIQ
jgi:nucleoside-triphosphatase